MHKTAVRAQTPRATPIVTSQPAKTPSIDLVLLEVEADDYPQVLLRVLGFVARDGTTPVTIKASRLGEGLAIAIELDGVSKPSGQRIAYRIAGIPTVRKVSLAGRAID